MQKSTDEQTSRLVPMPGRSSLSVYRRLGQVFRRYALRHLALSAPGQMLMDRAGDRVTGHVEPLQVRDARLLVCGATNADQVVLRLGDMRYEVNPEISSDSEAARFAFDLPFAPGSMTIEFLRAGARRQLDLAGIPPWRVRLGKLALWPQFLLTLMRSVPDLWRWRRYGDFGAREAIKDALGLAAHVPAQPLQADVLIPPASTEPRTCPVTIILPVYNAFDLLEETLTRVLAHTDLPWRLILVEDGSSDERVRPFLRDWVAQQARGGRIELIENPHNLGFVESVNEGFARALSEGPGPVILLNSDAFVPAGWASRLVAPILEDHSVASVTPMSNDAEIFSIPFICQSMALHPGEADRLDRVAQGLNPQAGAVEAPTGVGFCMALNRTFLEKVPVFDTAFGRGYGEETDWCQKTRRLGGHHLGLASLFVEHHGAGSFGTEEKRRRVIESAEVIATRYPTYDQEVGEFVRLDPMTTARLALAIALAADRQDGLMPVYLAHAMGGGAEKYLLRRIAEDTADGGHALVLRVGQTPRWRLELHGAVRVTQGLCADFDVVERLLAPVSQRNIVYNCAVGDQDMVAIPQILERLADEAVSSQINILMHDYLPLSPSYTLLDSDGVFRGLADVDTGDSAHRAPRPDAPPASLADWRAAWGCVMARANEITVFSEASRALVVQAYPFAASAIRCRPHLPLADIPHVGAPSGARRPVIGVLGNVGYQKGAAVLATLSRHLSKSGLADLVVIGNLDPGYQLASSARVHGSYRHADIPALVARYGITDWLIPSVWPETFSFATREALATGLPVWCFDLGAQAEAVRDAAQAEGQGGIIPLGEDGTMDVERLVTTVLERWHG